jgi:hypothetical protein
VAAHVLSQRRCTDGECLQRQATSDTAGHATGTKTGVGNEGHTPSRARAPGLRQLLHALRVRRACVLPSVLTQPDTCRVFFFCRMNESQTTVVGARISHSCCGALL